MKSTHHSERRIVEAKMKTAKRRRKPDNFVLQSNDLSAETVANSNPGFNRVLGRDRKTPLTVGNLKDYYQKTGMV